MPTSYTLEDLVAEESQALGDNFTGTTTAAGAATGLTLVSTSLLTRGGQGWHPAQVEITSGARDGDIRPTDFFAVSGQVATLTMQVAFGGQIDTGSDAITFRIHFIDPLLKREAVDEALRIASAKFPLYFSQDLLAGELLRNHSFEYWRTPSRLYDWEYVAGTLAREGTTVREGKYAASLTGTGSAGSVRLRIDLGMELNGVLLTFTCYNRVAASAAATQRISLQQGGTTGNSAGLSSLNTWTLQTATLTPSDPYQPIYAILSNITAQAVLYDQARLSVASGNDVAWVPITEALMHLADLQVGPNADDTPTATRFLHPHPLPGPIDRARGYAYFNRDLVNPVAWSDANASNLVLPRNQHLRLTGHARWPVLSALSDTIDLTEEQKDYIGVLAGIHAIYKALGSRYLANEAAWEAQGKRLEQRVALLEAKAVESATPIATQIWW